MSSSPTHHREENFFLHILTNSIFFVKRFRENLKEFQRMEILAETGIRVHRINITARTMHPQAWMESELNETILLPHAVGFIKLH